MDGMMQVPAGPGIGVTLDRGFLAEVTSPSKSSAVTIDSSSCAPQPSSLRLPDLEVRVWGGEYEMVSVNVLVATISEGGVAIGAFDGDELVGAVYGFATREPDVHHSHYPRRPTVASRARPRAELKRRQRTWCLAHGITAMRLDVRPLQYGNAHLNLRTLGAYGISYHVDHYGTLGGNQRVAAQRSRHRALGARRRTAGGDGAPRRHRAGDLGRPRSCRPRRRRSTPASPCARAPALLDAGGCSSTSTAPPGLHLGR